MAHNYKGNLSGEDLNIAIVVSRFNEFVTLRLLNGAKAALSKHGVPEDHLIIVEVTGSMELGVAAKKIAVSGKFDSVICLGAVIRGETDHYEHVASQAAAVTSNISVDTGIPVIFGVLTTDTIEQAINRAGGKNGNSGYNCGVTAIEMANLLRSLP